MARGGPQPQDATTATRGGPAATGAHPMFDTGFLVILFILLPAVGLLTLVTLVLIETD